MHVSRAARTLEGMLATSLAALALSAPLPQVSIEAERRIGGAKVPAQMRMRGLDARIAIGVRGRWSRRFPKKSYSLEVREPDGANRNVPLLGMPAEDDWILYAAYNDRTLIRNVLAYGTSRWMGRYAARTRFVRLRLNGRYHGVYVLMEKLKLHEHRVRAGDRGFLLERTSARQGPLQGRFFRTPVTGLPVVWYDPERGSAAARRKVTRAERALYRGPPGAWRRHIHGPAAIDHFLLNEVFKNQDAMHTSAFMSIAGPGRPLRLGPIWDFDHSMGQSTRGPSAVLPGLMLAQRPWAERLYQDGAFRRAMARRWRELRRDGLKRMLLRRIDRLGARLADEAARDTRRWPTGGHRPRGSRRQHMRGLRSWLVQRIAWLDRNL
ncbi:MAG: CotH kinase family protein [Solirubrobacteraceae bacterium]